MQRLISRTMRAILLPILPVLAFFVFAHTASAGTLTNFSYSITDSVVSATTDYTFNYTIETADPNMIFYAGWPSGFDLSGSSVTVTIDGTPATVGEYWNGGGSGFTYIRLADPTVVAGSAIVTTFQNVVNPSVANTYNFSWIKTADSGGNDIDTPASVDSIMISSVPPIPFSGDGAGTEGDPYQITSCAQIIEMNNDRTAAYVLTTDLDCTTDANNIMVGNTSAGFSGIFDGGNHTIIINIATTGVSNVGLFSYIENGGIVRHVTVDGSVSGNSSSIGMIAGILDDASAIDVHSTGTVTSESDYAGGLFGQSLCDAVITDSDSSADVIGVNLVGGISGFDGCEGPGSTMTNVFSTGDVSGNDYVGGIVGQAYSIDINGGYSTGMISGQDYVGGIIGQYIGYEYEDRKIFHAYATGDVSGRYYIGGFIGYSDYGVISQSYATGDVTAGQDNIGGFIGHTGNDLNIRDSYARGDVTITMGEGDAGGFIGEGSENTLISTSYSTGLITTESDHGGFIGNAASDRIRVSFWDTETSGTSSACGNASCDAVGKTTAQMKTQSTFTDAGWNLDTIWNLDVGINDGYPYLLGGEDEIYVPVQVTGPVETILTENQFHNGGTAQEWNGDDDEWEYELPFTFNFYGQDYTSAYVSSNGYVGFTSDIGDYDFDLTEWSGAPIISAMNGDLDTECDDGLDIYVTELGDNQVIFRWQAKDHSECEIPLNFEIVLHSDGQFQMNYGEMPEEFDESNSIGVSNGDGSYVLSEYSGRTDFNQLNTSAWNYVAPTSTTHKSSRSVTYGCKDPKASNYNNFSRSKPELCRYTTIASSSTQSPSMLGGGESCPIDQMLTQNLKAPSRNGVYNSYTKAIVKEAKILQGHMNRLGFASGPEDGILGPISDGAIKRMQVYLKTIPDGFIGPITRGLINASCKSKTL